MDQSLRDLEKRALDDPSLTPELRAAWVRAGRGWSGEPLPTGVVAASTADLYLLPIPGTGLAIELARIPAGLAIQDLHETQPRVPVGEFWIGRHPVTWLQWMAMARRRDTALLIPERPVFLSNWSGLWRDGEDGPFVRSGDLHPVVNIDHDEAVSFCSLVGCALPTTHEWSRAGGLCPEHVVVCPECQGREASNEGETRSCGSCRTGVVPRTYPWGVERPTLSTAVTGRSNDEGTQPTLMPSTVGGSTRLVPSRHRGASPWGVHDLVGNVWEMLDDGSFAGGCWRSERPNLTTRRGEEGFVHRTSPSPMIGFRVVVRAAPC